MPYPDYGLLGRSFLLTRFFQAICLVILIGLASHLISVIIESSFQPGQSIVAILSIGCLSFLYIAGSIVLYFESLLPLLVACALDGGFMICLLTLSIVVGQPLSMVSCTLVGEWAASNSVASTSSSQSSPMTTTSTGTTSSSLSTPSPNTTPTVNTMSGSYSRLAIRGLLAISDKLSKRNEYVSGYNSYSQQSAASYPFFISGGTQHSCNIMKAVWGFTIIMTILFFASSFFVGFLWWKLRKSNLMVKLKEGSEI